MKSYKIYARAVSIISALLIIIASLDATQVINLFPEYASQINTILVIAGILAPIVAQEKRVIRAEDLIREDVTENNSTNVDVNEDDELTVAGEFE